MINVASPDRGAGLVHVRFGGPGTSPGTVLNAVSGCAAREQASGTLERVDGGGLVVKTAGGRSDA